MRILAIEDFAGATNQGFGLAIGEAEMAVTLVDVKPLMPRMVPGARRAPFSLLFRSESQLVLPQQTYRLKHADMGVLEIFLVPVARDTQGIVYEAVFN